MKRIVLFFVSLVLLAGLSFGATYYVDYTLGNDSWDGLAPEYVSGTNGPWKTCSKVNGRTFSPDDFVNFKRGEIWPERLLPSNAGGTGGHPITFGAYGAGANPIFTGNGSNAVHTHSLGYLTFNDLTASGQNFRVENSTGIILNRVLITGTYLSVSGSTLTVNNSLITGSTSHGVSHTGTSVSTLNYCIIKNSTSRGVYATGTSSININNCIIVNNNDGGVFCDSSGTVNLKNSIVSGNPISTSYYGVGKTAGTLNYGNNLITGNGTNLSSQNVSSGCTDLGGNLLQGYSKITSYINNAAYFGLCSDDHDVDYWKSISTAIAPYGGKFTAFVIPAYITGPERTDLQVLATAGHEIAIHSFSHSSLTAASLFQVTSTNTNPTVDVDVSGSQITLSCDEAGNRVTLSWMGGKTILDLKAAISGKGWTITNTTNVSDYARLSSLADTGTPQVCPYSPMPDIVGPNYQYWADEIIGAKDWLTALGISAATMSYPNGDTNAALRSWLIGKLDGARGVVTPSSSLSSLNIYSINVSLRTTMLGDGAEAVIRANIRHLYEWATHRGKAIIFLAHNTGELSINQITWIADELSKCGVTFQTFGSIVAAIRADHSTADNITWTKTYPDVSDFHLLPGSSCINAGADVGLTEDCEGKRVPRGTAPDIGAYEYYRRRAAIYLLLSGN